MRLPPLLNLFVGKWPIAHIHFFGIFASNFLNKPVFTQLQNLFAEFDFLRICGGSLNRGCADG
jgi:hypothetical protein